MYVGIPVICGLWTIPNWDARPRSQTPLVNHRVPHCWSWSLVFTWSDIPYFTSCCQMHISNISRYEIQYQCHRFAKCLIWLGGLHHQLEEFGTGAQTICSSLSCSHLLRLFETIGKGPKLDVWSWFPIFPNYYVTAVEIHHFCPHSWTKPFHHDLMVVVSSLKCCRGRLRGHQGRTTSLHSSQIWRMEWFQRLAAGWTIVTR